MTTSFNFGRLPRIIFGNGKIKLLPDLILNYGRNAVLVTGRSSFIDSPSGKILLQTLDDKGIHHNSVIIPSEPSPAIVDNAVDLLKKVETDVVVSVGGGSAIDGGKAISAMLTVEGSLKDYLEGVGELEYPGTKVPFIAVPTTSGTGSEATKNAVISHVGRDGFKKSLRHENLAPEVALVDPELTLSCSPRLTSASGMDCFTQLAEAYLSDKANPFTDTLALEGMVQIKSSLLKTFQNGQDIEARSGMSFAALNSGICLANAGLGAVHGFASSIGGLYNIPHGVICGTLMAVTNELTVNRLRMGLKNPQALKKYARLGRLFLGDMQKDDDFFIDGFIKYLHNLTSDLKLPGLKQAGVKKEDLREIALSTDYKNNPVKLNTDDLIEILEKRFI
jgi:alcohol dehydrogenase class IV